MYICLNHECEGNNKYKEANTEESECRLLHPCVCSVTVISCNCELETQRVQRRRGRAVTRLSVLCQHWSRWKIRTTLKHSRVAEDEGHMSLPNAATHPFGGRVLSSVCYT